MHPSVRTILRFIGASVVGYLVIALGQTLVLEVGLKGRVGPNSPFPILGLAAFGTIVSGLIGGYLAGWLGGPRPMFQVAGVLVILALDAIYVIVNHVGGHPLWYHLGGAVTLMAATAVGGWVRARSTK